MMRLTVIVLLCALSTTMGVVNDEFKARVLKYMEIMFISPDNQRVDKFAFSLFMHGYSVSKCAKQTESNTDPATKSTTDSIYAQECLKLKEGKDVDSLMTSLVEKYVDPDKVSGMLLWNLALPLMPQIYTNMRGDYYYIPKRGCPDTKVCGHVLPAKPFSYNDNQCNRAEVILHLLKYHLEPRDLPMDYYTLAHYVLTNFELKPENIYGLDPDIKKFEIKHYLDEILHTSEANDDFVLYMMGRRRRLELYEEMANGIQNTAFDPWKEIIKKEIEFESKLVAMMVKSWMELTGLSPSDDGKLTLQDKDGTLLIYEPSEFEI